MRNYHFSIPFTLTPTLDTFKIGDTFCIRSIIPDLMDDTVSGEQVDVSNFDFKITNDIVRHDSTGYVSAEYEFQVTSTKGSYNIIPVAENVIRVLIIYEKAQGERVFEACLVPQHAGLYEIVFWHLPYNYQTDDVELEEPECSEDVQLDFNMNNGNENNYHLLQSSPLDIASLEVFKKGGGYAFVVVE